MVRLSSVIDEVVNACFTPEEIALLEIKVGERVVSTVGQQFLSVYRNRAYDGTKEELIQDFSIILDTYRYYLYKIEDINKNIKRLLIPQLYGDSKFVNSGFTNHNNSVTTGKSISESNTDNFEMSTVDSSNFSSSLNINQSGSSESNRVDKLSNLINSYKTDILPHKKVKLNVNFETKKVTKEEKEEESNEQPQYVMTSEENPREYQNLAFDQGNTFDSSNNYDASTSVSGEKSTGEDSTSSISSHLNTGTRDSSETSINENEARIKAWKLEITNEKLKFIHCFDELFCHVFRH